MVYKRKVVVRRKPLTKKKFKTKEWYDKKYSIGDMANSAWRATKYLASMINSEVMKLDTTVTLGAAQYNITALNAIAQSDALNGRTGNSILLKNIAIKGSMQINGSVTANTRIMLALVMDTQQIGDTNPSVSDIFTSNTDPHSLLNSSNVGRFKVIKRWNYWLTPASGGKPIAQLEYFKEFNLTHTRYNGTSSNDIQKNGLYLVQITSEATNYPTNSFNVRLSYHDN
nr:capsid protein [Cressdnaviricota sp.]